MKKLIYLGLILFLFSQYGMAGESEITTCYALIKKGRAATDIWNGMNPGTYGVKELIGTSDQSWDVEDHADQPHIYISVNPDAEKAKRVMKKVVHDANSRGFRPAEFLGCKTETLTK
jgi:creatinine amidohydrolase/Fe(II)-dependent formamide hydrolase-like protein